SGRGHDRRQPGARRRRRRGRRPVQATADGRGRRRRARALPRRRRLTFGPGSVFGFPRSADSAWGSGKLRIMFARVTARPTPPEPPTPSPSRFATLGRALRHRNFRLFFVGQGISLVGTWLTRVAASWLVYRLTKSALLLGLVGFAGQIPTFVVA